MSVNEWAWVNESVWADPQGETRMCRASNDCDIMVMSAGRTGSTLVWQVLYLLFGSTHKVEKFHPRDMREGLLFSKNPPAVIPERDPVDAYLSYLRCVQHGGEVEPFLEAIRDDAHLWSFAADYANQIAYISQFKNTYPCRVLAIRYEDFFCNTEFLFDAFQTFFKRIIPEKERYALLGWTSMEANRKNQKKLSGFEDWDKDTLIHGNHIWKGTPGYSKELLTEQQHMELEDYFHGAI